MESRRLGTFGPEISVVGYGAAEVGGDLFGANESDDAAVDAIRASFDAGMTWVDTAESYGNGRSEELVGQAVRGRRDGVLIFTKVTPKRDGYVGGTGLRPEQIATAIRRSLRRLGTDHVDLYHVHMPDPTIPLEDAWTTMAGLVDEGLTRHIGLSNVNRSEVERCHALRHVDSVQNELSMLFRDDCAGLLGWLFEQGIGYLAYGPLCYGILTGTIDADTVLPPDDWRGSGEGPAYEQLFAPAARTRWLHTVNALRAAAAANGVSPAELAVRWVLAQHGVTATPVGSRNPRHVRSNAQAGLLRHDLDPVLIALTTLPARTESLPG